MKRKQRWLARLLCSIMAFGMAFSAVACSNDDTTSSSLSSESAQEQPKEPFEPIVLENNGVAIENYKIVLPASANKTELYAGEIMTDYVKEATGVTLETVRDSASAGEYEIILGKTSRPESQGVDYEKLGDDGYEIKKNGEDLVIAANGRRGLLYGVYAYLEALGFRFYAADYTLIPEAEQVFVAKEVSLSWNSVFEYRYSAVPSAWDPAFAVQIGTNYDSQNYGLTADEKYGGTVGFNVAYNVHSFRRYSKGQSNRCRSIFIPARKNEKISTVTYKKNRR